MVKNEPYNADDLREPVRIEIQNWGEYNPRKDIKRPHWFALNNRILEEDDICYLSAVEKLAFIYILCKASQRNSAIAEIYPSRAETVAGIPQQAVRSALVKLSERGMVKVLESVRTRTDHVQTCTSTEQNTTIQTSTIDPYGSISTAAQPEVALALVKTPSRKSKELVKPESPEGLFVQLPPSTKARWAALYPEREFLEREVIKALNWCEANPHRTPRTLRGWSRFMSSWFDRGWVKHAKQMPTQRPDQPISGWDQQARLVLDAIRQNPPGKTEGLRQHLGEQLFAVALKVPGGFAAIRQMPANDFRDRKLASMLALAAEQVVQVTA
jgi:hypothetical protein